MINKNIKTLSELAQDWKDKKISDKEAREVFKTINILKVDDEEIESEEELVYITGNGNSWTELRTDTDLNREDRIAFKKVVGYI